jgi:hypothetical protein
MHLPKDLAMAVRVAVFAQDVGILARDAAQLIALRRRYTAAATRETGERRSSVSRLRALVNYAASLNVGLTIDAGVGLVPTFEHKGRTYHVDA